MKNITPRFRNEAEERVFWQSCDSTANKRSLPYQTLVKVFPSDRIKEELTGKPGRRKPVSGDTGDNHGIEQHDKGKFRPAAAS